MINPP